MKTIREQATDLLAAAGWRPVSSSSRKYLAYESPANLRGERIYLGKVGGIRIGRTVTGSRSLNGLLGLRRYLGGAA